MNEPRAIDEFVADYAAFLCAGFASFERALTRLPRPWALHQRFSHRKHTRAVLDAALAHSAQPQGMILEFGVYRGMSINHLARRRPRSRVCGFDSFAGFPEDARTEWRKDLSVPAVPAVRDNVELHVGYFEDTLPPFVAAWNGVRPEIALIHVDCDIYSSTRTVFGQLGPFLQAGDVIVFDELLHYAGFARNEMLAFYLMLARQGLDFEWAATWGQAYPFVASNALLPAVTFEPMRRMGYFQNQAVRLRPRGPGGHFGAPPASPAIVAQLRAELREVFPQGYV